MSVESELHDLEQRSRQYSDAKVVSAEIVNRRIEVTCKLVPGGEEIVAMATNQAGGNSGGLVRVPKEGETIVVSLQDGDPTQARMIGWAPTESTPLPEDIEEGITYFVAPDGEKMVVRADAEIEVTADGANVRLVSKGGQVLAGSDDDAGKQPLTLAPKVNQGFNQLVQTFNAHQHIYVLPFIPLTAAVTVPPTPPQSQPPDVGASNVKGD